jgi:hypothetical protein
VRDNGEPFTFGPAFVREFLVKFLLFSVFGWISLGIVPLLDHLWPLWDDNNETFHDKMVKTHVLRA